MATTKITKFVEIPMAAKDWYLSKTLWINVSAVFALIAKIATQDWKLSEEDYTAIVVLLSNIYLRFKTDRPIKM